MVEKASGRDRAKPVKTQIICDEDQKAPRRNISEFEEQDQLSKSWRISTNNQRERGLNSQTRIKDVNDGLNEHGSFPWENWRAWKADKRLRRRASIEARRRAANLIGQDKAERSRISKLSFGTRLKGLGLIANWSLKLQRTCRRPTAGTRNGQIRFYKNLIVRRRRWGEIRKNR